MTERAKGINVEQQKKQKRMIVFYVATTYVLLLLFYKSAPLLLACPNLDSMTVAITLRHIVNVKYLL